MRLIFEIQVMSSRIPISHVRPTHKQWKQPDASDDRPDADATDLTEFALSRSAEWIGALYNPAPPNGSLGILVYNQLNRSLPVSWVPGGD